MAGAWRRLARTGGEAEIVAAAKQLQPGERFDLVVDPKYSLLALARDDAELADAVRRPTAPRAMIVLDVAEQVLEAVEHFEDHANKGSEPARKGPGRPRNAERALRVVGPGGDGG